MGTIGDMLNNVPEPVAVTEIEQPEVQTEQPETAERPRGPDGKFISKEETGVEAPPAAEAAAEPVPPTEQPNQLPKEEYSALKDERRKRQALEDEIARLRAQAVQPPVQQPPVEFWDDPQAFMAGFGEQLIQKWEQKQQFQRIDASEQAAKSRHADYDEAFAAFSQAVQLNPTMAYEMAQASDPAEYAYRKGKTALEIQKAGSVDELRAQIRAELEAEARAVIQPSPKLPSTTAADGTVGARTGPEWGGPTPLGKMIG